MAEDLRRLARNAGAISVQKACDELASQYDHLAAGAARASTTRAPTKGARH